MGRIQEKLEGFFAVAHGDARRPELDRNRESSLPGLFVIGDLAGASVIKLAIRQGVEVAGHIATLTGAADDANAEVDVDVAIIGSGAAGLSAALELQAKQLRVVVLEKGKFANTLQDFPEGKWIYAEPNDAPVEGRLWLEGATKEELIEQWRRQVAESGLEIRAEDGVESIIRHGRHGRNGNASFTLKTESGAAIRARRIVLATGQSSQPRCLNVPGEDGERVHHRLYNPREFEDEDILIVGGGNSATEAALALGEKNRVTLSYRGADFWRLFKENRERLDAAVEAGRVKVLFESEVVELDEGGARLRVEQTGSRTGPRRWRGKLSAPPNSLSVPADRVFVLIGAEYPADFLKALGIRLENEWTGSLWLSAGLSFATLLGLWVFGGNAEFEAVRAVPPMVGGAVAALAFGALLATAVRGSRWAWLGVSFLLIYSLYGIKYGEGAEFWPYTGWAYGKFTWFERPLSFWYGALYTLLMVVFGAQAMKRWGFDRGDRFQIWRFTSLIGFQVVFMFLIPEFLFQWAVKYQWVGERLATDPSFADNAWRSYGIVLAWPLFFYTFVDQPHMIWIVWGALLSFGIIPVLVLFHGKRYCSWVCTCDGLAETVGDRWRHLAPKGRAAIWWERMNIWILGVAVVVTLLLLGKDVVALFQQPADWGRAVYRVMADTWLVGILPLTLYPFFGGKVWCRYWCPLAKMMELMSKLYTRLNWSRYGIRSNEKCIACGDCTRYCLVGIDVMRFAMMQETISNDNSSCIGCGICITVCPMDVLEFGKPEAQPELVQITR